MPLYDYECKCGCKFESIEPIDTDFAICKECGFIAQKVFPKKSPQFNLSYNPKTDMVDWNGNKTRYWDDYKKMKEDGKKPRIPALDGDG